VNRSNLHIRILIIFQLFVFSGPYIIKVAHHHNNYSAIKPENKCHLSASDLPCPVCKFEFLTSIVKDIVKFFIYQPLLTVHNLIAKTLFCNIYNIYYSLRAPPVF